MSYLRSPYYVWSDGQNVHIWLRQEDSLEDNWVKDCEFPRGIKLPNDVWDALCLMRVAEIDANHNRRRYEFKAINKFGGNFGSAALYKRCGITPPWVS